MSRAGGMPDDGLWRPEPDPRIRRLRAAHADAVVAAGFAFTAVPGDWDTGTLRAITDPERLHALIPPRRGPVQGPAVRAGRHRSDEPTADLWWPVPEPVIRAVAGAAKLRQRPRSRVAGASGLMAAATLTSRVTGLVNQLLQAAALGSSLLATAFTDGNTLPNMIYFLLIGGALNAVLVPQLVRAIKQDPDGGVAFTDRLLSMALTGLLLVTAAAVAAAPWIVDLCAGHLDPATRPLTVAFTRYCLPQIFFYGLFAAVGQVLNARDRFVPTAWAPILNNLVVIAVFLGFLLSGGAHGHSTLTPGQTRFLGVGTTAGVAAQAMVAVAYLRHAGIGFRPRFDWRGTGMRKTGSLAKWTLAYMLASQVANVLVMRLATAVDEAQAAHHQLHAGVGYAAYSKAQLIWILPQSVVTVSLLTALVPRMSRAAADRDPAAVRDDLSFGLRISAVAIVPAAFAFLALGPQLAVVLFRHGQTGLDEAHGIGYMLMAFGLGLVPFSAQYVILRGFYAFGDTRTPFIISVVTATVNSAIAAGAYVLLHATRWPVVVMAAGYGLSSAAGLGYAAHRLRPRLASAVTPPGRAVKRTYRRLILAAGTAAVFAFATARGTTSLAGAALGGSLVAVAGGGAVMVGVFLAVAKAMRIAEVGVVTGMVRARLSR